MILYHGTTAEEAKRILETGFIKHNITRTFESNPYFKGTTDGFVYLTNSLPLAFYYGNCKLIINECQDKNVYIFELCVPDELLCADLDELKEKTKCDFGEETTVEESLRICECVRCARDLSIVDANYVIIPGTTNYDIPDSERMYCCNLSGLALNHKSYEEKENVIKELTCRYRWNKV